MPAPRAPIGIRMVRNGAVPRASIVSTALDALPLESKVEKEASQYHPGQNDYVLNYFPIQIGNGIFYIRQPAFIIGLAWNSATEPTRGSIHSKILSLKTYKAFFSSNSCFSGVQLLQLCEALVQSSGVQLNRETPVERSRSFEGI
eukprot:1386549-Amphidinium_carterae.1